MKELEIFQTGDIEKNKSFQLNTNNPTNNINIANTLKIGKNLRFQNSYKNVSKTRGVLDGRRRSSYFTNLPPKLGYNN